MIFELSEEEKKLSDEFYLEHKNHIKRTTAGEWCTYLITPTGIGTCLSIKCNFCNKTKNITDYSDW